MEESSSSEQYRDKGLCEKLENYFWPYTATDQVCNSVCLPIWLFGAYRVLAFLANAAGLCMYLLWEGGEKFIYFTFWCLLLTELSFSLILLNYVYSKLWKFAHFVFELNFSLTVTTTLMYWIFLANQSAVVHSPWQVYVHSCMIGTIVLEHFNNLLYFFRRHFGLVVLVGLCFICINLVYAILKGPVYSELDPTDESYYLIMSVGFTFLVLSFVYGGLVDRLKISLVAKRAEDQEFLEEYADRKASILHTIFGHRRKASA